MPARSLLSVPIPQIDLVSLLLDGIPDSGESNVNNKFTRPFLHSAEEPRRTLSLVELRYFARCLASGLRKAGLQTGQRVMLVSPNYTTAIIVTLGVLAAGGVFCAAQPDYKEREYVEQFQRDKPSFLLVADGQPQSQVVLDAWRYSGHHSNNNVLLFTDGIDAEPSASDHSLALWTTLLETMDGPRYQWDRLTTDKDLERPCMLFTTSGTSGLRKSVRFTHRNLVASFVGSSFRARQDTIAAVKAGRHPRSTVSRGLHTVSISRSIGTTYPLAMMLAATHRQVELFLMSKTYVDMTPYLSFIAEQKITFLVLAPFTLARLFRPEVLASHQDLDFSSLSMVHVVGAPSSQKTLERVRNDILQRDASDQLRVERSLGMTEACALVSSPWLMDAQNTQESYQGHLEPNIEAKIMTYQFDANDEEQQQDTAATELPGGQPGELYLRSPSFVSSYYQNASATKQAFTPDGWFKTGDIAYLQEGDKLFLIDRKKDILKTPDNIPPAYIENVLMEHPDIEDAGVIGIYEPKEELQLVRAYLVRRVGSAVTERGIQAWMERESASTAHLTAGAVFVDELPRNASGKLLRRVLREWAASGQGSPSVAVPPA